MVVVRRVRESGSGDRIDRPARSLFGLAGKIPPKSFPAAASGGRRWGDSPEKKGGSNFGLRRICPPEKFSGGGEWWPAVGRPAGEEGGERD
ncbi:hypothetical protein Tco_1137166, partial [Tanacetum coccineum]